MNYNFYSKFLFNAYKLLAIICCVFLFSVASSAQKTRSELQKIRVHLGLREGLSDRQVNSAFIAKDSSIWFLANNKIGEFKHGKIRNYSLADKYSNRGFNSAVEDSAGNFWISENYEWYYPFNVQRCVIFNPKTKKTLPVEIYIHQNLDIHSILADNRNQIYIGTSSGQLYSFDVKRQKLQLLANLANTPIKVLYAGRQGIVACVEQTIKLDRQLLCLNSDGKIKRKIELKNQFVRSVIEAENHLYYTYFSGNILGLKALDSPFDKHFPTNRNSYLSNIIYNKNKQVFVINESDALGFFDLQFNKIDREPCDFLIHNVIFDNYGNYLLATDDGVHILRIDKKKIKTFLENKDPEKVNENISCRAIISVDHENIIVNTNQKRHLIDLITGKIKVMNDFRNLISNSSRFILTALKDSKGDLLFGEDALVKTNLHTMKDEVLCVVDSTKIWALAEYKEGYLLGLEKRGILYYDKTTKRATPFFQINKTFRDVIIYDFYIHDQQIYIASEIGIYQLLNENTLKKIDFPMDNDEQITCFSIKKDKKHSNQLLISTNHGIWMLEEGKQQTKPFLRNKNYYNNKYLSAYRTNNGVWASSENGVWHFDDAGNLLKIYTVADGMTSNECNRLAHFQDTNDVLYFGGINGINVFNPTDFSTQAEKKFELKIDSVITYNETNLKRTFTKFNAPILQLFREEQGVKFIFDYEDFKFNCEKQYYYKNNRAITKDWQLLPDHELVLNNIDEDTTRLEFMVVSCDNFVKASTQKLILIRPEPLYKHAYFWIFVLSVLALLIWGSIRLFTDQLKRRNEQLQKKIDQQTHALIENLNLKERLLGLLVHDVRYPIQSFYDLSKKLSYLIQKNDEERLLLLGKETESKSRKVLWLIDELVYWVKSTNHNLEFHLQECNLEELIHHILVTYSEELKEKNLKIQIAPTNTQAMIDKGLFIIVMRNLIFNAIIHSNSDSLISIKIEVHHKTYRIEIRNEFQKNEENSERSLGVGMTILKPILTKAHFKIDSYQREYHYYTILIFN